MNVLHVTSDLGETDILRREFSAVAPDLRVECAGTPGEAIERLEAGTGHYDAVLLELTQTNGEGLSLVSHIRRNNLPVGVVAITSVRDEGPSREALTSGADHLVVKGKGFLTRLPTVLAHAVKRRTLEARLRVMLETAPACLMRVAGDGTILAMNIAALDLVDAERVDQVVDRSWYERVVPDAQAGCRDFIERASNGERGSLECQIQGLSGTHRTVLMHAVSAPVDAGGAPSALVVMRDQDRARGLEAGLEQYRQKLGAVEKALSEVEAQNQELSADHEAERAEWQQQLAAGKAQEGAVVEQLCAERERLERALKAAEAQNQQLAADHEADRAAWQQQLAAGKAQEGAAVGQLCAERERLETALAAADAKYQQLTADHEAERAAWEPQLGAAAATEKVERLQAQLLSQKRQWQQTLTTLDERHHLESAQQAAASRALQDQVRHSQSLETVASFIRDVGADLDKLAATIVTQSTVVLESLPKRNPRRKAAASLSAAAVRAAALTHQLLAISRKQQRATRTMDLNAAIGQLDPVLRRLVGEDIEFAVEPASQLDPVQVDPDHVEQLLLRLAVVVREAMPAGGVIRLGTSSVEIDDAHVREHPGVPPGRYARLTVRASGWGMDPQMQDRVSSAVASGEDSEGAKELGLASALRALRDAGGHIVVEAEPGRELSVDGYLPTGC